MSKHPAPPDPIAKFKVRTAEFIGLAFFLILVADTFITEVVPILKHIWHTIHAP